MQRVNKSKIWLFFQKHGDRSICDACNRAIRGHTHNLKRHLWRAHPDIVQQYFERTGIDLRTTGESADRGVSEPTPNVCPVEPMENAIDEPASSAESIIAVPSRQPDPRAART